MMEFWRQKVLGFSEAAVPLGPPLKVFVPKYRLPAGNDGTGDPGLMFWANFPINRDLRGQSLISPIKLESLARAVVGVDMQQLELVCGDLRNGADIGCRGAARGRTVSGNAAECKEFPGHITDAVASWLEKGFAAGPFEEAEVPAGAKVIGMMCRPKPSGAVRVILNMSAPAGLSVNDGIDGDEFPATMSSTAKWVAVLNTAGRGCLMTKADWSDAYKHIRVRAEDRDLQWFRWLDKLFVELCLVFGTRSSPGIYDRAAKVVLDIVLALSRFPRAMVCQYLDDVCAAAPAGSTALQVFREVYRKVAEEVGVRLAPEDDPEKAFAPTTLGTVLGVSYNTVAWTWEIPADKLGRLNGQLMAALGSVELKQKEVWSLVGRVIHYCPLVAGGRFNIHHLVKMNGKGGDGRAMVKLTEGAKRQLKFWLVVLNVTAGLASIPADLSAVPAWSREFFTDAAGGSVATVGLGCGGVSLDWWFYLPWGRKINSGVAYLGRKLSSKMSALELVGPLVCVAADPDMVRGMPVRIWVDNIGSVKIWKKGYSNSCNLCTTLVTAIATVAASLGCRVYFEKVLRCSVPGAAMADALSKGAFDKCRGIAEGEGCPLRRDPACVPPALLAWVANPQADEELGADILRDMRKRALVLGYNC